MSNLTPINDRPPKPSQNDRLAMAALTYLFVILPVLIPVTVILWHVATGWRG